MIKNTDNSRILNHLIEDAGFTPTVWVKGDHRSIAFSCDTTEREAIARLVEATQGDFERVTELVDAIRDMTTSTDGYIDFRSYPEVPEDEDEDA